MIVSTKIASMFKHCGFVNIDYLVKNKLETNPSKILNILNRDWRKWVKPVCMKAQPKSLDPNDPNFGYETKGANNWSTADILQATRFPSGGAGTGVSMTAYIYPLYDAGFKTKFALYDGNNLVNNGVTEEWYKDYEGRFDDWKTLNFISAPTIANQDYKLVFWNNGGDFYYDSSETNQWSKQSLAYGDSFPNPASFGSETAYKWTLYCSYTTGGAGLSIPVAMHHYRNLRET